MWKKKQKPMDERIERESNQLFAKLYYVMLVSALIMLVVKLVCKLPIYLYVLEIISLLTMILYVVVKEAGGGVLFMKNRDDATQVFHEGILAKAFNLAFNEMIDGEILVFIILLIWAREYVFWACSYFAIWVPATLVHTVIAIKKGWFVWGTKKKEQEGKENFGKAMIKGSIFFGCFMGIMMMIMNGGFAVKYLMVIPVAGALWGIPCYFGMLFMMKKAEKQADKMVKEVEDGCEE